MKVFLFLMLMMSCSLSTPTWIIHTPPQKTIKYIPIVVDEVFSSKEQHEIQIAVEEWNVALNGNIKLEVVNWTFDMEPDLLSKMMKIGIVILSVSPDGSVMRSVDDGNLGAKVDEIGGHVIYLLKGRATLPRIKLVTEHELGHVLGAEHQEGTLMDPVYKRVSSCIDHETIKQIAKYNNLNPDTMNWCQNT